MKNRTWFKIFAYSAIFAVTLVLYSFASWINSKDTMWGMLSAFWAGVVYNASMRFAGEKSKEID